MIDDATASFFDDVDGGPVQLAPCLIIGAQCAVLELDSRLVAFDGISKVVLGRGSVLRLRAQGRPSAKRLELPDSWMSVDHARVQLENGICTVHDEGSKNGSFVNGRRIESKVLDDGDVIEVGTTFFVYRSGVSLGFLRTAASELGRTGTFCAEQYRALKELERVAETPLNVLLQGETGTGKEVAARKLHEWSGRTGPFLGINCAAIAGSVAESELFGHKKGAFSGAHQEQLGLFRAAERGTLLLDEVADLALPLQAKLLRVLQEREVLPVGGTRALPIDVRVVSASSRSLDEHTGRGEFRRDLLARLAGHKVELLPLRRRKEDLGLLLQGILGKLLGPRLHQIQLKRDAVRALYAHDWPGNVRELEQALGAAVALGKGDEIGLEQLPEEVRQAYLPKVASGEATSDLGARLRRLLAKHQGNVSAVGRELEKAPVQVRRWCRRLDIDPARFRVVK